MAHLSHKWADWGLPVCPGDCTTIYTEHMQGRECPPLQDYSIVLTLLEMGVGSLSNSRNLVLTECQCDVSHNREDNV